VASRRNARLICDGSSVPCTGRSSTSRSRRSSPASGRDQQGSAHFAGFAAQRDLIVPPSPARHHQAGAEGDPAPRLQFVEAERPTMS